MGVLSVASLAVVAIGLFAATFSRLAILECKKYVIEPQNGKIVLITGANSGLGYHTSLELARAGASVIMGCRSKIKCDEAKASVLKQVPNGSIESMVLDLSSFQSVKAFTTSFMSKYDRLDVLVNNAGIMGIPKRETTVDGLESQIGTNHFGHFMLTALLFPIISKNGRIVNHSSGAHHMAAPDFPFSNIQSETSYDPWVAYGNSKAANLLFTYELNNRLARSSDSRGIISVALHPGYTNTNLQAGRFPLWEYANALFAMRPADGALSQIEAAVGPHVTASHQNYIGPKFIMLGAPAVQSTGKHTWDSKAQKTLWEESVRITGVDFVGL
jgi:NAD(P)-dependent dehydrogenase (short-subunit alcohol dehydrogenase family)